MSAASLLMAASLAAATTAPSDDAPPDEDELVVEDDADDDDDAADDDDADPDDADDTEAADADAASDDPAPEAAPGSSTASIPTEGKTKPPPSPGALERDSPLSQPDPRPRDRAGRLGSPQRFALEFKMGPYLPDVDRDYTGPGRGPYGTIFGRTNDLGETTGPPKPFPMPVLAFDWQFFYLAGPLGIGAQVGLFRDAADALVAEPTAGGNLRTSADKVTFTMIPLAVLASYRFELLADRFRVPLVPYVKGGLVYSLFWSKGGSGNLSRNSQGEAAIGGVPGWQLNAGGMLRLDFIEPGTAKKLDSLTGINHTYVFGEYQLNRVNNFGVGQVLNLGDSTWFVGLAIEF